MNEPLIVLGSSKYPQIMNQILATIFKAISVAAKTFYNIGHRGGLDSDAARDQPVGRPASGAGQSADQPLQASPEVK